ncbi:bifunctional glycosyltransferase/CDP-glycerol:glycerophosphate glycerophosphotransferase [Rubneribacter sp.]
MSPNSHTSIVVSVVIPAHNSADTIPAAVESLRQQTIAPEQLQIVLVNDGSADDTLATCAKLAAEDDRITVVDKPNGGVGSARNAGIEAAEGRYIAFLDSDDTLLPETLEACVAFFDERYDEVDLVTYPMRLYDETREWPHVREQVLTETGVYDLTKLQNAFALVTNVNVLVKNDVSLPRFREDLLIHEDELFFLTILLKKLKVGFCKTGAYRYRQLAGSAIATKMHPFYQFEKNIGFWEDLFAAYPHEAPLYLQASFLNEVNWKIRQDLLFPYHYESDRFQHAIDRIRALMGRVCDDVIFTSPRSDEHYRHYLASLKPQEGLLCTLQEGGFVLRRSNHVLLCRNSVEADIVKTRVADEELHITGILRSVLFQYAETPALFLTVGGDVVNVPLLPTSHDYHEGRTRTNRFWRFETSVSLSRSTVASLSLSVQGRQLPLRLTFSSRANLDTENGILAFDAGDCLVKADAALPGIRITRRPSATSKAARWLRCTRSVAQRNRKALAMRAALAVRPKRKRPLWLYYDRSGVGADNAFLQFLHDSEMDDGIERFYVTKDDPDAFDAQLSPHQRAHVIGFASPEHRLLHLEADRIVAAYIEHPNWCPFAQKTMRGLADLIRYDVVYLQHGVLHAHMPWKYSADRLLIDYMVVSTRFEEKNLTQSYGFANSQLIRSGMPRYDTIDLDAPSQRRILFAPSWRKSLVAQPPGLAFEAKPAAFRQSSFWRSVELLLSNARLTALLEEHDYHLDIKLHPIFRVYETDFAALSAERIHLVDAVNESDYRIFVTDYSSWVFDFVYLKRAIAYFLPDEQEFRAGLNGYRELDLPLEEGFGPIARTPDELLDALESLLDNGGKPSPPHAHRMEGFFLHYGGGHRERLYKALMESWKGRRHS